MQNKLKIFAYIQVKLYLYRVECVLRQNEV